MGSTDPISESKMVHEVCKKISSLRMEYRAGNGNRLLRDTPDELYGKYISIVAGLPEDATKWSLTLCSTFFSALVPTLQDKMEEDNFIMPSLHSLISKTFQLRALRLVRTAAVSAYDSLFMEERRLRRLFPSIGNTNQ